MLGRTDETAECCEDAFKHESSEVCSAAGVWEETCRGLMKYNRIMLSVKCVCVCVRCVLDRWVLTDGASERRKHNVIILSGHCQAEIGH